MSYLNQLNKILPDLLLRMELAEKNKIVDCHCCVNLTDEEFEIIHKTDILQFFGCRLEFKVDIHYSCYNGKLKW